MKRAVVLSTMLSGLLVLTATSGCSSHGSATAKASPGAASDLSAAALQVAKCMRGKGFDVPDPTFDADGVPNFHEDPAARGNAAYEAARTICRKPFNEAWVAAGKPNEKTQSSQDLLAYAQCLRQNGVNVADPDPSGNWSLSKELMSSPAWKRASTACASKLPSGVQLPGAQK
ncbi:hypothetical protein [Rugosimonospora africana]|uniref:Lipoprotein n=1 Tax=Rugosimonospora africana TaxID=556532 RepID=A0A8J3QL58_9ACTN|nr:hypothetical protein [Rugosimonospora africana]GIH13005.1 hypothetical protein Raf01_11770 [Rugosimonospora africana]